MRWSKENRQIIRYLLLNVLNLSNRFGQDYMGKLKSSENLRVNSATSKYIRSKINKNVVKEGYVFCCLDRYNKMINFKLSPSQVVLTARTEIKTLGYFYTNILIDD